MNFNRNVSLRRILGYIVMVCSLYVTLPLPAQSGQTSATNSAKSQFAGTWSGQWAETLIKQTPGLAALQSGRIVLKVSLEGTVSGVLRNDTANILGVLSGKVNEQGVMAFTYSYTNSTFVYVAQCVLPSPANGRSTGAMICFSNNQKLSTGKVALLRMPDPPVSQGSIGQQTTTFGPKPCPVCHGTGQSTKCLACYGTGDANTPGRRGQNPYQEGYVPLPYKQCEWCRGSGRTCLRCRGTGKVLY